MCYMYWCYCGTCHLYQNENRNDHKCIPVVLTHWGRVTHICVGKLTTIGSDNGLAPSKRQALIWTNAGILLIGPIETNFSDVWIGIQTVSFYENAFENVAHEMASILYRPQCIKYYIGCIRRIGFYEIIVVCTSDDGFLLRDLYPRVGPNNHFKNLGNQIKVLLHAFSR